MKISYYFLARTTLILTLLLSSLLSFLSYKKIHELIEFDRIVIHTHRVIYEFENVMYVIREAESGQRGFLITKDSTFLDSYLRSKSRVDSLLGDLKVLTTDNSVQQRRLDSVQTLLERRYELLNFAIYIGSKHDFDKDVLVNSLEKGRKTMDEIRQLINRCQQEEEGLLFVRNKEKEELVILTPIFNLLLSFFSLGLILFSYFTLMQELRKKIVVQKELELKIEELNRSTSELEQFAYVASHDLQEPLRKIRSFGDRLLHRQSDKLDEDGKLNVQRMFDAAVRMQKLIEDLLGFSRLVRTENKFELTNLNDVMMLVINDLDELVKTKKGIITVGNLPVIYSVPTQMQQLFQNLITNALKFSKEGVPPEILIQSSIVKGSMIKNARDTAPSEYYYEITVTDNGIGFDEKYLDRIFVIFQRLHGKMEYGGTGIGLAVSKKIISNHKGYITASSKTGQGATFKIYLPINYKI